MRTASKTAEPAVPRLPSVERLAAQLLVYGAATDPTKAECIYAARSVLGRLRRETAAGAEALPPDEILRAAAEELLKICLPAITPCINATGVVLHTGLGRARLAEEAAAAIAAAARSHSTLEVDRETGGRGYRGDRAGRLLSMLTGAEHALVVNNCAAAVFLCIACLASGRDVLISRGELVEIGGSFRMPDIIRAGGARLVEVGSTNRTRIADYADACTPETALILRCRPSNFAMTGFTEAATTGQLVELGRARGVPVMVDQGSGAIVPAMPSTDGHAECLAAPLAAGCSVVTASGDKLLGGPQCGIILGARSSLQCIAAHPLARAMRVDKLTLAGLEATLSLYAEPDRAKAAIPTLRYLGRGQQELKSAAQALRRMVIRRMPAGAAAVRVMAGLSAVGGGSLPDAHLPTHVVVITPRIEGPSAAQLAVRLRKATLPIFGRITAGELLLDVRTVDQNEMRLLADAVAEALRGGDSDSG